VADDDVLGKADALLRRHAVNRPGTGVDTGGIPVLTDIVGDKNPQNELAREVFKRVMAEVEGRLAGDLEARLAHHLSEEVHKVVAATLADLHEDLAKAVGDAVMEALSRHR